MLFDNINQFVVLAALLVIGWLFGFASHPGGKKWRVRYQEEMDAAAAYRNDADQQLRERNRRIAELERDHAALATQLAEAKANAHVPAAPVAPVAPVPVAEAPAPTSTSVGTHEATPEPVAASAAVPAFPAPAEHHDTVAADPADRDNLARIRGIDGHMQGRLEALGVSRFEDVEKLSAEDEMALEQRLDVPAGYIAREQWRDQAALLRAGNVAEHDERFAHG